MRSRIHVSTACLFAALLGASATPAPAQAQPATTAINQAKAEAKRAADRGQELFEEGRYEEAIAAFREADRKFHAPTFLLMIAQAHERRGRLCMARDIYRLVVDEKLASYAPDVFFEAQAAAKADLEALVPRIPRLRVTVRGAPAADVRVLIDGSPTTLEAMTETGVELDPGEHTVTIDAPGRAPKTRRIDLHEGTVADITMDLPPPPPPAPAATRVVRPVHERASSEPPPSRASSQGNGYARPTLVAFGTSGLALIIGVAAGLSAQSEQEDLSAECLGKTCYDTAGGHTYDEAQTMATVSNVSFAIAGVAAATGTVLMLWPNGDKEAPQAAVRMAPGWVALEGRF